MAIGVLCGKKEIMEYADTFGNKALGAETDATAVSRFNPLWE